MAEEELDKSMVASKSSFGGDISGESIIHSLPMSTQPAKKKKSMRGLLIKDPDEVLHFSSEKPERKKPANAKVVVAHSRCETCPNLEVNIIDRTPPRPLLFNRQISDKRSSVTKLSLSKFLRKHERNPSMK